MAEPTHRPFPVWGGLILIAASILAGGSYRLVWLTYAGEALPGHYHYRPPRDGTQLLISEEGQSLGRLPIAGLAPIGIALLCGSGLLWTRRAFRPPTSNEGPGPSHRWDLLVLVTLLGLSNWGMGILFFRFPSSYLWRAGPGFVLHAVSFALAILAGLGLVATRWMQAQ